jgi:hypothetical protein
MSRDRLWPALAAKNPRGRFGGRVPGQRIAWAIHNFTEDAHGRYVWHCHIVEHEDNEMMRPYVVGPLT